jgi:two-component system nitrate/nitrite sensor histidine kinase NarX
MNRLSIPAELSDDTEFFWTSEPEFIPPDLDGGVDACVEQNFTSQRPSDLETLLNNFLETSLGMLHARAGVIRILMPDEQTLPVISAAGLTSEELEMERVSELACEDCNRDAFRHGMCATDIADCETRQCDSPNRRMRSVISIPLEGRASADTLLGVFTLFFDKPQTTSSPSARMAVNFADLLAGLIEHTQSGREARRAELLMERQSIANEIHDSLAQTLNYARMNTTLLREAVRSNNGMAAKYVGDIEQALEIGQKAVRALITDFRSEMDPSGLLHALQDLGATFRRRNHIVLDIKIRIADLDLPLEHEIQAYNIVREALSNIEKHSNASHARVIVDHVCGYYVFMVEDNGVGTFSPTEGHYGLIIMRERAHRVGGDIRVESTKGLGTCVQFYFPEPEANWRTLNE